MLCTACGAWSPPVKWDRATPVKFSANKTCPRCGAEHPSSDVPYRIRTDGPRPHGPPRVTS